MNRTMLMLAFATAGTFLLGACNKTLKDDIKSLQGRTDSLRKSGSEIQKQLQQLNDLVGNSEPISATTTFQDLQNGSHTIGGTYRFRSNSYTTQSLVRYPEGIYEITIARSGQLTFSEYAYLNFQYDPASKKVSRIIGQHYWANIEPAFHNIFYFTYNDAHPGLTMDVGIQRLDLTTGDIALTCTATGKGDYTDWVEDWKVPVAGKEVKTVMSFTGKLQVIDRS